MFHLKINSVLTDENNEKFFGNGPLSLLLGVKEHGSLAASAKAMDMSYSKAVKLIRHSEEALGFPLLESHSGGKHGGSSSLSEKGEIFLSLYQDFTAGNRMYGKQHLDNLIIPESTENIRIIILASGQGKRFGENKLLYPFRGKPLISSLLNTLHPLKDICIVSTIHKEVKDIAEEMGYACSYHESELRSDSIKAAMDIIPVECATMFVQADQPLLTLTSVIKLIKAFEAEPDRFYKLSYENKKAAPTVFPQSCFGELKQLSGEEGGSAVVKKHPEIPVIGVEANFPWEIWDADQKEDLIRMEDIAQYLGKERQ